MKMNQFNSFNQCGKTAYRLAKGEPIFSPSIYLINPKYIHNRSPAYSLVSKGKHISGLFPACGGFFTGDFKKQSIVACIVDGVLDLWMLDMDSTQVRKRLCEGSLSDILTQVRCA